MSSDPIAALYRANYDRLCRVAYRLTACAETSHDLVQDTFLLALFHRRELLDALFALPAPRAAERCRQLLKLPHHTGKEGTTA